MSYKVHSKCIVCNKDLADSKSEAFFIANAREINNDYCSFDSAKKFLICKSCMFDQVIKEKYKDLDISETIKQFFKFTVKNDEVLICTDSNHVLNKNSSQKDVDNLLVSITKKLLNEKGV